LLGFGRRDVADRLEEPPVVEPVYPFQGRELHRLERAPRATLMDDLGFVESVDRFCESIVIGVADASDGRLDAGFGEALGVFDRDVLGRFKWSSQRLMRSYDDQIEAASLRSFW
jgi:hypothetical protein